MTLRVEVDESNCVVIVDPRLDVDVRVTVTNVETLVSDLYSALDEQKARDRPMLFVPVSDGDRAPLTERSRCGIHGLPTGSGRCAACDEEQGLVPELAQDPTGVDSFERYESPTDQG